MADLLTLKISELPEISEPSETAVVPVVSNGATYKMQLSNISPSGGDSIVERGTSNGWIYEKYDSGDIKAWKTTSVTVDGENAWSQSEWIWRATCAVSFPTSLFTGTISHFVNFHMGVAPMYYVSRGIAPATGQINGEINYVGSTAPSVPQTFTLDFLLIGKWK